MNPDFTIMKTITKKRHCLEYKKKRNSQTELLFGFVDIGGLVDG